MDLAENPGAPTDVTFIGNGAIFATAAFYHRFAASVGNAAGLAFHLKRGAAGLPAFEAEVKRLSGNHAQIQTGRDDSVAAASARRGTSLQALALVLFGVIVALAMLVIVAQSTARQAYATSGDFPVLRALGTTPRQLFAVALAPAALVAAGGMALAIPVAYGLSALMPIGLARRAEISPDSPSTPRSCWAGRPPWRCCWPAGRRSRRCAWCGSAPACPPQRLRAVDQG